MDEKPGRHRRLSLRARAYDYAGRGGYFVTICTRRRACLFGEVVSGEMRRNALGEIVKDEWFRTAGVRPGVLLHENEFVVMPNHVHGVIWIVTASPANPAVRDPLLHRCGREETEPGTTAQARARGAHSGSLGAIVGQFKSLVTKRIHATHGSRRIVVWQRNYYEHVIRHGEALDRIRRYILDNPARWELDDENPFRSRLNPGAGQRADPYPW